MSPMRATKKDRNHNEIRDALRGLGWLVIDSWQHAQYTPGFPDLVAICPEATVFVEVKALNGKLTPDESRFRQDIMAAGAKYAVVDDLEQAQFMTRIYWPGRVS